MIIPSIEKKNVAVIGGGPAGMYAALTASKRGHKVTLYDKTDCLGGTLKFAGKVEFKYSLAKFRDYLTDQIEKSPVKVVLGTEASPDELQKEGYDAIIAAVGAEPMVPPIPGIEHTIYATDTYGIEDTLGDKLIVIGGGQVGCETALHLARLGKTVTILEMRDELAPDASRTHRDDILAEMKKEPNLIQITAAKCTDINPHGVSYEKGTEKLTLSEDHVILAAGMKPRTAEADALAGISPFFWAVGDCVKARTVEMAVREGYFAGINI